MSQQQKLIEIKSENQILGVALDIQEFHDLWVVFQAIEPHWLGIVMVDISNGFRGFNFSRHCFH